MVGVSVLFIPGLEYGCINENQASLTHADAKELSNKRKQEVPFKNRFTKKSDNLMILETETLMLSAFYGTPRVLKESSTQVDTTLNTRIWYMIFWKFRASSDKVLPEVNNVLEI